MKLQKSNKVAIKCNTYRVICLFKDVPVPEVLSERGKLAGFCVKRLEYDMENIYYIKAKRAFTLT